MPLSELEQSFIEQFHVYLKSDRGLKLMTVCGYLKCLKYVVKIAFNNGWMPRNPFALYSYTALNPDQSFLTEEELYRMMTTRLRYKSQDFNRDMFLFSCFTGICYADMSANLEMMQLFSTRSKGNLDSSVEVFRVPRIGLWFYGSTKAQKPPDGPAVDDAPRMPARGHEFLKPVGTETAVQIEGAARDGKTGREGEEDAEALRDAAHVHSGKADEDAQKPRDEQYEVLRCEPLKFDLTADSFVHLVFGHRLEEERT